MYNLADKTYKNQPRMMTEDVTEAAAIKIANHARRHQLSQVSVVAHGGEPLLLGKKRFRQWVKIIQTHLEDITTVIATAKAVRT